MKLKLSEIIEIILAALLAIALVLKNHVPYMGLIFVLSAAILAMIYFYGGFFFFKSQDVKPVYAIIYGLIFSLALITFIFKLQKWPYDNLYLVTSISCFLIVAFVRIISVYLIKNKNIFQYNKGIAIRYGILLLGMLCLLFY